MIDSEKLKSWRQCSRTIIQKWHCPFIFLKWLYELLSYWVQHWSFLNFLRNVECLTILVAVIFYFWGSEDRKKVKHYQAWQVINTAQGKSGSGGRMDALQDLYSDGVSLEGIDISEAHLPNLNLNNAYLTEANFSGARLPNANLTGVRLWDANLVRVILPNANLAGASLNSANIAGASLFGANLSGAKLNFANLTGGYLAEANLDGADLTFANLTGANLKNTNLSGANLFCTNLSDANLSGAKLDNARLKLADLTGANLAYIKHWQRIKSIELANIHDVKNPPNGFIEWAKKQGAVSIEDDEEWEKLIREKNQEKPKEKK